jgi:hypothetical protein
MLHVDASLATAAMAAAAAGTTAMAAAALAVSHCTFTAVVLLTPVMHLFTN